MTRGAGGGSGFTLVEILVAITILLVVAVSIHTSFALGLRFRNEATERSERLQQSRQLAEALRQDLRNVVPVSPNLAVSPDRLSLLRRVRPGSDARSGLLVTYEVVGDTTAVLVRREEPIEEQDLPGADAAHALLEGNSRSRQHAPRRLQFSGIAALGLRAFTEAPGGSLEEAPPGVVEKAARLELSFGASADPTRTFAIWLPRVHPRALAGEDDEGLGAEDGEGGP